MVQVFDFTQHHCARTQRLAKVHTPPPTYWPQVVQVYEGSTVVELQALDPGGAIRGAELRARLREAAGDPDTFLGGSYLLFAVDVT